MTQDTVISSINRNGTGFTLANKRVLKAIYNANSDRITDLENTTVDPVALYGGYLIYGSVTWLSGLIFDVSKCGYVIEGVEYESPQTQLTLTAADATHPRIDVIYLDENGAAGYITGVPAADPAKPEIDATTQLEMTFVTVAALATTPDNTNATPLYLEDAGASAEWDATESTTAARIDLDNTEFPYAGTKCIKLDSVAVDDSFTLTDGVSLDGITTGAMDGLEMHIRNVSWPKKASMSVAAYSGASRVSAWVQLGNGPYFGFSTNLTGEYQTVNIPKEAFQFSGSTFNRLVFQFGGRQAGIEAYIDNIRIQGGGGTTIVNNYTIGLTEDELINNVRTWNAQQPFGNDDLTDGATIAWNLDVSPVATVEIDGNRTINFENARPGGTYILKVKQGAGAPYTVTWNAAIFWPGGTAPTLTETAAATDIFTFVALTDVNMYGTTAGLNFS